MTRTGGSAGCVVCRGGAFEVAFTAHDRSVPRPGAFRYERCLGCRLLRLSPLPAAGDIASFYPDDYAPHDARPNAAVGGKGARRRDARPWNRLALRTVYAPGWRPWPPLRGVAALLGGRLMRDLELPRGRNRLLDVGCGAGAVLLRHRALGWEVRGVEPSARGAAACRAEGLAVEPCGLEDAVLPDASFDVVLLKHVVEHVRDPRAALQRARRLLAPGGLLVVVTPNTRGIGLRAYGACWYAMDAPRHLHLFDAANLRRLAVEVGLRVESIRSEGSTRVLARSRCHARLQGEHLPASLEERRTLLAQTRDADAPVFRRLVSPAVAILAGLGAGDTLRARFTRGVG